MAIVFKMRPVALNSEYALGRRNYAFAAGVKLKSHAQGTAKGLENGLALVVRVLALEVVDMQGDQRVISKALEKFPCQVDIEATDVRAGKGYVVEQARATGEINHHPRKGFIQRHIGVPITAHAGLVSGCSGKGLTQCDADIFDRMVVVNVNITIAMDVEIDEAMPGDLVQHVVQKGYTGVDGLAARAIKIDGRSHAGFLGIAGNVSGTHVRLRCRWIQNGTRHWRRVPAGLRRGRGWRRCVRVSERRPATL